MSEDGESVFLYHQPCANCGSSDAGAVYSDGHTFCFKCQKRTAPTGEEERGTKSGALFGRKGMSEDLIRDGSYGPLLARKIDEDTCRRYRYQTGLYRGETVHIANYVDPSTNETIAQKLRFRDKSKMPWLGDSAQPLLFGQWVPVKSHKCLIVTEGELDCLSMSQVQGNKWPVVSLPSGTGGAVKSIKQHLEWVERFESVILMFDMDEQGRKAAIAVAALITPGKVRIANLPLKDPNEMLVAGRGAELSDARWNAPVYRPAGIVSGAAVLDRLKSRPEVVSYPYPEIMPKLNAKTYGIRLGELDVWTSGTGMGKTTLIKELQYHFWQTTGFNQALIHLEEVLENSAESLVGIHLGKRLGLPDVRAETAQSEIDEAASALFLSTDEEDNNRIQLYDSFGSMEEDDLIGKIRYFAKALNCKIIWIDHLSILVSDSSERTDERRLIDRLMHTLASLAVELNVYIGLISHLKKAPQGKSFEEGYIPSLDDLRGSGGIKQLAFGVYALSRNQQDPNEQSRNTSTITVLKCRFTGRSGPADHLLFDDRTGRMVEGVDPAALREMGLDESSDVDGSYRTDDDIPF